jgi:hypothetical protein
MHFSLDVLRARKGDCLMLHYGTQKDPHLMLIDGGPSNVYKPQLKQRIKDLRRWRGLDDTAPLPVDVVMVSHIDDDHIRGLIEMTEELRMRNPGIRLRVGTIWHNSFEELFSEKLAKIAAGAAPRKVLASIPQGRKLAENAKGLGWKRNGKFSDGLILATGGAKPISLDGDLQVTVAGPMQSELLALRKAHEKWLLEQDEKKKKTAEAMLAAFVDKSVPNLSSIVLFAQIGKKSMLLTGDARGDKILEGLELTGVLEAGKTRQIDILKVPHHGSVRNMEPVFFRRLPAKHYVFSGNGEHGNPERATLEMLLEARGPSASYKIHFTYPIKEIDKARKAEWDDKKAKKAWSARNQSLAAFFEQNPKMAKRVCIVKDGTPHFIDLLEPVFG